MKRRRKKLASLLSRPKRLKRRKPLVPQLRWLELQRRRELPAMLPNKLR